MRKEANNHQTQMEDVVKNLKSEGLDSSMIEETTHETEQKATEMMEKYLGDPDSLEALEFLCLAEAGELTHYEVLNAMTKGIKNKQITSTINSVLEEEQKPTFVHSIGQENRYCRLGVYYLTEYVGLSYDQSPYFT